MGTTYAELVAALDLGRREERRPYRDPVGVNEGRRCVRIRGPYARAVIGGTMRVPLLLAVTCVGIGQAGGEEVNLVFVYSQAPEAVSGFRGGTD